MPARKMTAARASAKMHARTKSKPRTAPAAGLGRLPEWNLADLYDGIDDPKVKRDLDRADSYSVAFEEDFKGKLAALAERPDAGAKLAEAVTRYEQLDDLIGRLMSFAGLIHAGDTVDPARAKFYGDAQDSITGISNHLPFFVLELNVIHNTRLEVALLDAKP